MTRKRAKVMIVDDNDIMRTLLRSILRAESYEVVGEARNGLAAAEMALNLKPQLVCMDVVAGKKKDEDARRAFIAAAIEAGTAIRD